jgi:hypothetical protein
MLCRRPAYTAGEKRAGTTTPASQPGRCWVAATLEGLKQAYLFLRTRSLAVDALFMGQGDAGCADVRRRHREQGRARWGWRLYRLSWRLGLHVNGYGGLTRCFRW